MSDCCPFGTITLAHATIGFAPSSASLGTLSFKLHKHLADAHDGRRKWGYCASTGFSLSQDTESAVGGSGEDWLADGTSRAQAAKEDRVIGQQGPVWLRPKEGLEVISQEGTVAQM